MYLSPFIKKMSLCNRWRISQKTKATTSQNTESWSPVPALASGACTKGSELTAEEGLKDWKSQRSRELAVRLFSRNVRNYTHEVSSTWMPKHDLSKDETNNPANIEGECSRGLSLDKELHATKGMLNTRHNLPQRTPMLVIQYQVVIPEIMCIQVSL